MKKNIFIFMIIAALLVPQLSFADKIKLNKTSIKNNTEIKTHPVEQFFNSRHNFKQTQNRMGNKLLVLLIDFQEDNDANTTGNGKFQQDPADYPFTLGSPPHDHNFFNYQLEALKYYYDAVSLGSFNLDADIYPQSEISSEFKAYTLPHEMGYYNPPNADQELMISRFEEYFQDAFAVADEDEEIDFSIYDHFMIIHAGSDWQHDVKGDSPSDIPSFFIQIGDGKEAVVDNGSVIINHACNVPETITQDIEEIDGTIYNYGVINAVMAHEFGHSLGFVDLYNTINNSPQVGYYDIMDSGGSVELITEIINGKYYTMEGTLPSMPGAWSRILAFESFYRANGILKDISDFDFDKDITVIPSGTIPDYAQLTDNSAYFIKVPINDTEYLLIENRQVDIDGDGSTVFSGDSEKRVILYPTINETGYDFNNQEYDMVLPGWVDTNWNNYGGGLVIWHIDEKLLYENNNFENNQVNTWHSKRAVKVIEADNFDDIGNPSSYFWQGTAYEPFFKYMPVINEFGDFEKWDDEHILHPDGSIEFIGKIANNEYSASTQPQFTSNAGDPCLFSIYDISSYDINKHTAAEYYDDRSFPGRVMTFKFGTKIFDHTEVIAKYDSINAIGNVGSSFDYPTFPLMSDGKLDFYSKVGDSWELNFGENIPLPATPSLPVLSMNYNQGEDDSYLIASDNKIYITDPQQTENLNLESNIVDAPLFTEEAGILTVATEDFLRIYHEETTDLAISNARLAYNGSEIVAVSSGKVYFINPETIEITNSVAIPNLENQYNPVCYEDSNPAYNATYIQNNKGNIYKIQNYSAELIFRLSSYTSALPTQLAIGDILDDGMPYITFGADDRVFAISLYGTLAPEFPAYIEDKIFKPTSYPRIIKLNDEPKVILEETNGSFISINTLARQQDELSFLWDRYDLHNQFYWDELSQRLYYIFADASHNLYTSYNENIQENPIIWNGYRNAHYSLYRNNIEIQPDHQEELIAYAFPNPAQQGDVRIKVINATSDINLRIFDIAGNIVFKQKILKEPNNNQDIRWNISQVSSGVYYGVVQSGDKIKKVPIAIIK